MEPPGTTFRISHLGGELPDFFKYYFAKLGSKVEQTRNVTQLYKKFDKKEGAGRSVNKKIDFFHFCLNS